MKRAPSARDAVPGVPPTPPHGLFLDDVADGERADAAPREDAHTPAPDIRAEEPCGEIALRVRTRKQSLRRSDPWLLPFGSALE